MSFPHTPDTTLKVSWVLSQLDEILHINSAGRAESELGRSQAEKIQQAIRSMKADIVADRSAGLALTTSEMTTARLTSYFGVKIPSRREMMENELKLSRYSMIRPLPPQLEMNLKRLAGSDRYDCPDISTRLGVELLILECQVVLADTYTAFLKHPDPYSIYHYREPDNPPPSQFNRELPCRILADQNLSVAIIDRATKEQITITGRGDWVFGYRGTNVLGYFGCITVVQPADFSSAETTLITNLAIIRQSQIDAREFVMGISCMYTDGVQYVFLCISAENELSKSRVYDIWRPGDLSTIYNYALSMLDRSLKYLGC